MFKLTIVAGPNRGASYKLAEGETSVGRNVDNVIVLPSAKVSKRHCVIQVANGAVTMIDQGSSNGTFVNGVLAKSKTIQPGDRISVGDCVLQLVRPSASRPARLPSSGFPQGMPSGNAMGFPGMDMQGVGGAVGVPMGVGGPGPAEVGAAAVDPIPTDLKGKVLWYFEKLVMPVFYGILLKNEWKIVTGALFALFGVVTLVVSIYPMIESNHHTIMIETSRRARFMAREIAERNTPALAARAETKTEIGSIDREPGVAVAVLTDLSNRILAPAAKSNQYLAAGTIATRAVEAAQAFNDGRESGFVGPVGMMVVAIEPVKVFDPRAGRNVVIAMSVVALDMSISVPEAGTIGVIYSKALVLTGVLGVFVILVLYRLTLKPFEVLNEDMDKVLKGDLGHVTREFQFGELKSLWDIIDSSLQRIPKNGSGEESAPGMSASDFVAVARMLGDSFKGAGLVLCDEHRRVLHANGKFEDITGIRADEAVGQELGALARDQAFAALVGDMFGALHMSGASAVDDFDFSGVPYRVHGSSFGAGTSKGFVFALVRSE